MKKKILIIEDQLCNEKSHHLQYLTTINDGAPAAGIELSIAANILVTPAVTSRLSVLPILHDVSGLAGRGIGAIRNRFKRFAVVCLNCFRNSIALQNILRTKGPFDYILCLTTWWPNLVSLLLLKYFYKRIPHIGLLFVNYPRLDQKPSRQLKVVRILLKCLQRNVKIFTETQYAQNAWSQFLNIPIFYVVHPVNISPVRIAAVTAELKIPNKKVDSHAVPNSFSVSRPPIFGFYGLARFEQGADILLLALEELSKQGPLPGEFRILWPEGFFLPNGHWFDKSLYPSLKEQVVFYETPFLPDEYICKLNELDWIVLPYRPRSYAGRLSRISVEACVLGIPMIYSAGTDCARVVKHCGSGLEVESENVAALAQALCYAAKHTLIFSKKAEVRRSTAVKVNAAEAFWNEILKNMEIKYL